MYLIKKLLLSVLLSRVTSLKNVRNVKLSDHLYNYYIFISNINQWNTQFTVNVLNNVVLTTPKKKMFILDVYSSYSIKIS